MIGIADIGLRFVKSIRKFTLRFWMCFVVSPSFIIITSCLLLHFLGDEGGVTMLCLQTFWSQPQVQTVSVPGCQDRPRMKSVWVASSCLLLKGFRCFEFIFFKLENEKKTYLFLKEASPSYENIRRVRASPAIANSSGLRIKYIL